MLRSWASHLRTHDLTIDYIELFDSFSRSVCREGPVATRDATLLVKNFFAARYGAERQVFPSAGERRNKEFLLDLIILDFAPGSPVEAEAGTHPTVSAYLAVESELGGEGGTSAGPLRRNVEYDFAKLLLVRAQHKVMVFTSLPLRRETGALEARVKALQRMYDASGEQLSLLLIHVEGLARKTERGVGQVAVSLQRSTTSGYVVRPGGIAKLQGADSRKRA